jgi:hypothetical protein
MRSVLSGGIDESGDRLREIPPDSGLGDEMGSAVRREGVVLAMRTLIGGNHVAGEEAVGKESPEGSVDRSFGDVAQSGLTETANHVVAVAIL